MIQVPLRIKGVKMLLPSRRPQPLWNTMLPNQPQCWFERCPKSSRFLTHPSAHLMRWTSSVQHHILLSNRDRRVLDDRLEISIPSEVSLTVPNLYGPEDSAFSV